MAQTACKVDRLSTDEEHRSGATKIISPDCRAAQLHNQLGDLHKKLDEESIWNLNISNTVCAVRTVYCILR